MHRDPVEYHFDLQLKLVCCLSKGNTKNELLRWERHNEYDKKQRPQYTSVSLTEGNPDSRKNSDLNSNTSGAVYICDVDFSRLSSDHCRLQL